MVSACSPPTILITVPQFPVVKFLLFYLRFMWYVRGWHPHLGNREENLSTLVWECAHNPRTTNDSELLDFAELLGKKLLFQWGQEAGRT